LAYYLIACAFLPTLLKAWTRWPSELVRKIQHITYSLSIFLLLNLFSSWYTAVAGALLLLLLGYPGLLIMEKFAFYQKNFVDRSRGGELRKQLVYVQLSFALLIFIFWGLLGEQWRYVVAAAVMAWGYGDAAAALVGKAFGRRPVLHPLIENAKTVEGTIAMILFAGLAIFFTLLLYAGQSWPVSFLVAAVVAPVSGVVELFSRRGIDTLTVPLSTAFSILPLMGLLSLGGW
jgi:phytol kinase